MRNFIVQITIMLYYNIMHNATTRVLPQFAYKYLPIHTALIFLKKGLSFSKVSDFSKLSNDLVDKNEFASRVPEPLDIERFKCFIKRVCEAPVLENKIEAKNLSEMYSNIKYDLTNLLRKHNIQLFNLDSYNKATFMYCYRYFELQNKNMTAKSLCDNLCNYYRVCCLSKNASSEHLWSHSTIEEPWVCLELEIEKILNELPEYDREEFLQYVNYTDEIPTYSPFYEIDLNDRDTVMKKIIFRKNLSYRDEEEIRFILPNIDALPQDEQSVRNYKEHIHIEPANENINEYLYDRYLYKYLTCIKVDSNAQKCHINEIISELELGNYSNVKIMNRDEDVLWQMPKS